MDYCIVITENSPKEFAQKIRDQLNAGWKLYGDLIIVKGPNGGTTYAREMIKNEPIPGIHISNYKNNLE